MSISKDEQVKFLASQVKKHKDKYYNEEPVISDSSFDALEEELKKLDLNNNAVVTVGSPPHGEWKKAKHVLPLGSLDKVKTPEELSEWVLAVFKPTNTIFVIEKLDGLSIEVIYKNGNFIQSISRGDGYVGSDQSENVSKMAGIKKQLPVPFTGSLRGEILLRKSKWQKHFPDQKNPRNAAVGISKRLDGVGSEHLDVFFYQAVGDREFKTEYEQLAFLQKELGLQISPYYLFNESSLQRNIDAVNKLWDQYQSEIRSNLDWELDGLVVRINELEDQKALGELHLKSKGAKAFKFKSESAVSKVIGIVNQIGNSGRITPVIEIEPVNIMGVEVSRASLYNYAYITEIGLDIGAKVLMVRANDVIPRCEAVLEATGTVFQTPTICPACDSKLEMQGENLTCPNSIDCPAQVVGRIKNWVSSLNILEWGDALIERLVYNGWVENISDLYRLEVDELMTLERMGEKSAENCYKSLWSHNPIPLEYLLGSLSIPMVGVSTIQMIMAAGYITLDSVLSLSCEDACKIKGIGNVKAEFLVKGLKKNAQMIKEMLELGLKIEESPNAPSGALSGKSFAFSGTMVNKRIVLEDLATKHGGEIKNSVNKSLTYLVIADTGSTSSKAITAKKLGVKLLSEEEFLSMTS